MQKNGATVIYRMSLPKMRHCQPVIKYNAVIRKAVVLYHIGKEPLEKGMNILGAHIDSPRLDIKQVPLYEDSELVLMDTHYYGRH